MGGEIETGHHSRLARIGCDVDHRHTAIALLHSPDVRRRQAEQITEDRFVDGVMGHHQSGVVRLQRRGDLPPAANRAGSDILNRLAVWHLNRFGCSFQVSSSSDQSARISDSSLPSHWPWPISTSPSVWVRETSGWACRMISSRFGWPGKGAAPGTVNPDVLEKVPGCSRLAASVLIQRDVDLSLETPSLFQSVSP